MESKSLFYEKQYFRQWWILIIFIGINGLVLYGSITQIGMGITFGDKPMSDMGLLILTVLLIAFTICFTIFFFLQKLVTKIDEAGIHYKFMPYHKTWRTIAWDNITTVEVKKYNPVFDYGGWGLRTGCVTMSGNKGIYVRFNNDSLMIGTKKAVEVEEVLRKLGKI